MPQVHNVIQTLFLSNESSNEKKKSIIFGTANKLNKFFDKA
jgi:hypothetical protein